MPSNLAPEIIVTVQNPDPQQCETTSGGSHESEDCGSGRSSGGNSLAKNSPTNFQNASELAENKSPNNKDWTSTSKVKTGNKHHRCQKHSKVTVTKRDSRSSITTAIDMVEGKPRLWVAPRKSASAVRVQVTLHRPLNWQIVPTSSSAGSIPKHSSSSTKSTVTHSHSLSQSESLSFSISPSSSIHYGPQDAYNNRDVDNHYQQHHLQPNNKGKVRFTNLPRSRLGRHIEKIQEQEPDEEQGIPVSKSLCYCHCANPESYSAADRSGLAKIDLEESSASRSVFPKSSFSSGGVGVGGAPNQNECVHNGDGGGDDYVDADVPSKQNPCRRKKSRSASARRRASSYHAVADHQLDVMSSSSDNEDNNPRGSSFQRDYYPHHHHLQQADPHLGLRHGTRRRRKNKSALSATVSTVNQEQGEDEHEADPLARDNSNIFDPVREREQIPRRCPTREKVSQPGSVEEEQEQVLEGKVAGAAISRKKLAYGIVKRGDSQKENFTPSSSSRCQYHSSFVLKRPGGKKGEPGIVLESSKSFDSVRSSSSFNRKKKPNQREPRHCHQHHIENEDPDSESHDSAQYYRPCHFDPMTWFKEPSGAEDPHANNKGSGMGANGSSHDGRLKSRSQSSSALYCIGKSGNSSIIESQGNYGNHNPYSNCHSTAANGLSSSIPADIWDLPCTAKSYSPVSTTKQNRQNINHYIPENYHHLDSYLNRGGGGSTRCGPTTLTTTDVETNATSGSHNSQGGHPTVAIGPSSSAPGANNVPVGQVPSRSGKKEKGNKKSSKSSNTRAKLYAASCPDVAEQTEYCGNLPVHPATRHHSQSRQQFDFTGDPRFIGISEAVAEELDSSCNSIATGAAVAMTGSSFADIRAYPLSRNSGAPTPTASTCESNNSSGGVGRGNLNSNNHMAQSHPHLYAASSANNGPSSIVPVSAPISMEAYGELGSGNMIGVAGPLFYSQQELQHFQNIQHHNSGHNQQHFQQQPFHNAGIIPPGGGPGGGRSGSSRSSHHSRSYQNLPCSLQSQQYGSGSSSINQPFSTSSASQQQLYNQQQQHQFSHSSSTRSRKSMSGGDIKSIQFQMPQFVAPEYVFEVRLIRDHRGLGLSVTGGLDSQETYPGLIRVKKVFPMGPAYESGELQPYDIILEANGVALSGLTNHEALELLRTTPTETILTICRPPINIPDFHDSSLSRSVDLANAHLQSQSQPALNQLTQSGSQYQSQQLISSSHQHTKPVKQTCVQCGGVQRRPPEKSNSSGSSTSLNPSIKSKSLSSLKIPPAAQAPELYGEFEVTLEKINGSLGFTLRQEDSSILGHYVRALVKDPALSDGRIYPGDRIIAVNGQDLSEMSHADAINFLRSCPPEVTLRLYRDVSPTPISPLSPTESHKSLKAKPLRKEAIDMLNDLAVRKQISISSGMTPGSDPKHSLPGSLAGRTGLRGHRTLNQDVNGPATLPRRRLAHAGVTPSPEVLSAALSHFAGTAQTKSSKKPTQPEVPATTTPPASNNSSSSGGSSGYRSSASRLTAANTSGSSTYPTETRSSGSGESTPVGTITSKHGKKTDLYRNYSDLRSAMDLEEDDDDGIFKEDDDDDDDAVVIDKLESGSEQATPKATNRKPSFRQYTMNLDMISSLEDDESFTSDLQHHDSIVSEPGYPATDTEMGDGSNFKHGQPAYQSAILSSTTAPLKFRGKGSKFNKDAFGSGFRIAGGDSPSTLSDADIPSTLSVAVSKTTLLQTKDSKSGGKEAGASSANSDSTKPGGLQKWKGVLFSPDNDDEEEEGGESTEDLVDSGELDSSFRASAGTTGGGAGGTISSTGSRLSMNEDCEEPGNSSMYLSAKHPLPQRRSPDGREFRECDTEVVNINQCNGEQIFTVQLSRRWCLRLGFSLQGSEGNTYISAIYPDSIAGKDGRLRVGDELIMINGETVRGRSTSEIIDMMRKIRGVISITLHRRPNVEPEFDPKDHELGLT